MESCDSSSKGFASGSLLDEFNSNEASQRPPLFELLGVHPMLWEVLGKRSSLTLRLTCKAGMFAHDNWTMGLHINSLRVEPRLLKPGRGSTDVAPIAKAMRAMVLRGCRPRAVTVTCDSDLPPSVLSQLVAASCNPSLTSLSLRGHPHLTRGVVLALEAAASGSIPGCVEAGGSGTSSRRGRSEGRMEEPQAPPQPRLQTRMGRCGAGFKHNAKSDATGVTVSGGCHSGGLAKGGGTKSREEKESGKQKMGGGRGGGRGRGRGGKGTSRADWAEGDGGRGRDGSSRGRTGRGTARGGHSSGMKAGPRASGSCTGGGDSGSDCSSGCSWPEKNGREVACSGGKNGCDGARGPSGGRKPNGTSGAGGGLRATETDIGGAGFAPFGGPGAPRLSHLSLAVRDFDAAEGAHHLLTTFDTRRLRSLELRLTSQSYFPPGLSYCTNLEELRVDMDLQAEPLAWDAREAGGGGGGSGGGGGGRGRRGQGSGAASRLSAHGGGCRSRGCDPLPLGFRMSAATVAERCGRGPGREAVPPFVAAIASLSRLRSLDLSGTALWRLLDEQPRLAALSALTALTRLRLSPGSDADPRLAPTPTPATPTALHVQQRSRELWRAAPYLSL